MRLLALLPLVALAVVLPGGCGGGSEETTTEGPPGAAARACPAEDSGVESLRATSLGCAEAGDLVWAWRSRDECQPDPGASRRGCSVGGYLCTATATDRGWSVGCAIPGRSIAFRVSSG